MAFPPWLAKFYAPFNFSDIPRFPNEGYDFDWINLIGLFHVCDDSAILHVASFMKVMAH